MCVCVWIASIRQTGDLNVKIACHVSAAPANFSQKLIRESSRASVRITFTNKTRLQKKKKDERM